MDYAYAAFWMFCAVAVICYQAPKIIRSRAEAKCPHKWEKLRDGQLAENIGEPDEKIVGRYTLFRCEVCGAERQY